MTVLVTGASGHVGLTLIQKLLESGRTVRALDIRTNPILEKLPVEFIQGDLRQPDTIENAFRNVESVFHLASYISIQMYEWPILEAINVKGVQTVLDFCKKYEVPRYVHFSSIEALDVNPKSQPIDETNALVPNDFWLPYPRSKARGHRLVLKAIEEGLNGVIIYPTAIIGPNDYTMRAANQSLVPIAIGKSRLLPNLGYDFVDVRDIADGTLLAEQKAPKGAAYILGNQRFSMVELGTKICKIMGLPMPSALPAWIVPLSAPFLEYSAKLTNKTSMVTRASIYPVTQSHEISHRKATNELGYSNRSIDQTLQDMLNWFIQIGKINT